MGESEDKNNRYTRILLLGLLALMVVGFLLQLFRFASYKYAELTFFSLLGLLFVYLVTIITLALVVDSLIGWLITTGGLVLTAFVSIFGYCATSPVYGYVGTLGVILMLVGSLVMGYVAFRRASLVRFGRKYLVRGLIVLILVIIPIWVFVNTPFSGCAMLHPDHALDGVPWPEVPSSSNPFTVSPEGSLVVRNEKYAGVIAAVYNWDPTNITLSVKLICSDGSISIENGKSAIETINGRSWKPYNVLFRATGSTGKHTCSLAAYDENNSVVYGPYNYIIDLRR